jgi:hypothetical protein
MPERQACRWRPDTERRLAVLALAMLAACAPPATGSTLAVADARFSVPIPPGWHALATDRSAWADGTTVALISSGPLEPQCATANPAAGCTSPVAALGDGATLLWWRSRTCAGAPCELPAGERMLVGGRSAVRVEGTHLCDALGATTEVAYLVSVTPQRVDGIVNCERNATDAQRAAVLDLLERVGWHTP